MSWKFTDWYDKNKKALSDKRKERYKNDKAYREAIIAKTASRRKANPVQAKPGQSLREACATLGVEPEIVSRWRNSGYIPVPTLRAYRFSASQVSLVGLLVQFFGSNTGKLTTEQKASLDELVQVINHNWEA